MTKLIKFNVFLMILRVQKFISKILLFYKIEKKYFHCKIWGDKILHNFSAHTALSQRYYAHIIRDADTISVL